MKYRLMVSVQPKRLLLWKRDWSDNNHKNSPPGAVLFVLPEIKKQLIHFSLRDNYSR